MDKYAIPYRAVCIYVLDGASNCNKAMEILAARCFAKTGKLLCFKKCVCHQLGRAAAHGGGFAGKVANSKNPLMAATLKSQLKLATKFNQSPSLRAGLSDSQLEAGIKQPLRTTKKGATRWNGLPATCARNRILRPHQTVRGALIPRGLLFKTKR